MNKDYRETIRVGGYAGGTDAQDMACDGHVLSYHIDTQDGLDHFSGLLERLGNN